MSLRARLIVEGYVSGVHSSPYHGFSIEFAEHREYVAGDDLRYVDWKVFGKTDKFYLKQYRGRDESRLLFAVGHQREHALQERLRPRCPSSNMRKCIAAVARLPRAAAAGQRRSGDVRPGDSHDSAAQQQSVAPQATAARHGAIAPRAQDGHRADLSRPGRAAEEARAWS